MLTPPIGAAGTYKVSDPFQSVVDSATHYECKAVRRFVDVVNEGVDPYSEYYAPYNISQEKYQQDYTAGACIVSLVSSSGVWVHVPTTYITSYPSLGGIPYTAIVLGISLGAVPDYLDLTAIKKKISDSVMEYIGVSSTVTSVKVSQTRNVSYGDHQAIETARVQKISERTTDYAKLLDAQARIAALQQQLQALQTYIKNNVPTG